MEKVFILILILLLIPISLQAETLQPTQEEMMQLNLSQCKTKATELTVQNRLLMDGINRKCDLKDNQIVCPDEKKEEVIK